MISTFMIVVVVTLLAVAVALITYFVRDSFVAEEPRSNILFERTEGCDIELMCVGGPLDGQLVKCRARQRRVETYLPPPVELSNYTGIQDMELMEELTVEIFAYVRGRMRLPGRPTDYHYLYPENGSELEYGREYLRRIGVTVGNTR